jgi:hypothetical protein
VLSGEIPSPIDLPKACFLASRCPFVLDGCHDGHPGLDPTIDGGRLSRCYRTMGVLPPITEEELLTRATELDEEQTGATVSLTAQGRMGEGK